MKKLTQTIIFAALLLISVSVSVFLFLQVKDLKSKLDASLKDQAKTPVNASHHSLLDRYLVVDSLLAQGKYAEARLAYQKLLDKYPKDEALARSIKLRMRDLVKLDQMQQKLSAYEAQDNFEELSSKLRQVDSLSKTLEASKQSHQSQRDSLNFALAKSKVLTESFRRQLANKLSSDYLSFTNEKGVKVYYVGNVKGKQANGQGFGLYSNGNRYQGDWKNNLYHGVGTLYWSDGEYYNGNFQFGKRQGQGSYYWPNGDKFIGEWQNDKRNGLGVFYKKNGKIVAKGIWKNNKFIKKKD
ncbi:MAG TPA: hypothetical protein DCS93_24990 [Microscillaceae bacterium]|nr:hypothetical protein [Microscillaceae bacterium]